MQRVVGYNDGKRTGSLGVEMLTAADAQYMMLQLHVLRKAHSTLRLVAPSLPFGCTFPIQQPLLPFIFDGRSFRFGESLLPPLGMAPTVSIHRAFISCDPGSYSQLRLPHRPWSDRTYYALDRNCLAWSMIAPSSLATVSRLPPESPLGSFLHE